MRDGWVETTFRAFALLEKGISYKSSELCDEGEGMPFINLKSIDRGGGYRSDGLKWYSGKFKSSQVVEPGDLILCCTDLTKQKAILGYPILVPAIGYSRFCISLDLAKILVDEKMILKSFLFLLLQDRRMREFMQSRSSGTTVMHLKTSEVPDVQVALPPLPEQKRIVDLISSVDSYIETLQQELESAKKSRNAVLHELLTAGGDDWVEHKLIEMFEIYQPQTIAKSLMSEDGEFIVFGANGPIGRYQEFNHDEPEVVVTCRGATCGTINMTPPKTWITGNAMVVSPKTSGVSREFLYWALTAGVDIQSVISGSAQPQITREGLAPVKIKIPPLSRQIEIVDLISGFELNISHLEESLYKTKTLRSGLLSDLLSGAHEIPASYDKIMGAA